MKKSIIIIIFLAFFWIILPTSCVDNTSSKNSINPTDDISLLDNVTFYSVDDLNFTVFDNAQDTNDTFYNKTYNPKVFLDSFYTPWNYNGDSGNKIINEIWEEFFTYETGIAAGKGSDGKMIPKGSPCFTGNLRVYSEKYEGILKANLPKQVDDLLTPHGFGITIETTDLRVLPTDEFCFKRIRNSGEGYPFDELQLSSLWVGTPIRILATSIDNSWYFVHSTYGKGWVRARSMAIIDKAQINYLKNLDLVVVVGDNVPLRGKFSPYKVFTGAILPYDPVSKQILYPCKSLLDNTLLFDKINKPSKMVRNFPIAFNKENVKLLLSQMIDVKYSWGGIDGGRDCSSTLKDYFTPFGIWLPRNSEDQSKTGKLDTLAGKTIDQKIQIISEKGIPFLSTLYKPGHISLYVGKGKDSQLLMYHTVWGIKAYHSQPELYKVMQSRERYGIYGLRERENNQVETRPVIGKTVITDIELDKPLREIPNLWIKPYLENMVTLANPAKL